MPVKISQPKQLLVEGVDDKLFFLWFLKHLGIDNIQIHDYKGTPKLTAFLEMLVDASGFRNDVQVLGIVRDADDNPHGAFQSVQGSLTQVGLAVPDAPEVLETGTPNTAVLILPQSDSTGSIETLCLNSVRTRDEIQCVDELMDCVEQVTKQQVSHPAKARITAYIAVQDGSPRLLGEAAQAGYWPWDEDSFAHVSNFLNIL